MQLTEKQRRSVPKACGSSFLKTEFKTHLLMGSKNKNYVSFCNQIKFWLNRKADTNTYIAKQALQKLFRMHPIQCIIIPIYLFVIKIVFNLSFYGYSILYLSIPAYILLKKKFSLILALYSMCCMIICELLTYECS